MDNNTNSAFADDDFEKNIIYDSIFSIKSKDDEFEILSSMESYSCNPPKLTMWDMLVNSIDNAKNYLVFNMISSTKQLDPNKPNDILVNIYNEKFDTREDEDFNKFKKYLTNFIYFSYRKNFCPIINNKQKYCTDAGWGCTIRAGQMALAQAIKRLEGLSTEQFYKEKLLLFLDEKIPKQYLYKFNMDVSNTSFQSLNDDKKYIRGFEKAISEKNKISNSDLISPPFSVRKICTVLSKSSGKGAGDWFSNFEVINTFIKLNDAYDIIDEKIMHFKEGTIYLNDIIKQCFTRVDNENCNCMLGEFSLLGNNLQSSKIDEEWEEIGRDEEDIQNLFKFKDHFYRLKKKFMMFVSVRHGLYKLEEESYKGILNFFDIKGSFGMLGGKGNRAFYCFGKCENNLIFLDPHFVQNSNLEEVVKNSNYDSYKPKNWFYIDISEISPSFSLIFIVRNENDLIRIIKAINEDAEVSKIIAVKNEEDIIKDLNFASW